MHSRHASLTSTGAYNTARTNCQNLGGDLVTYDSLWEQVRGWGKKERKKWRTSLSPKAMGPRAAAGGKCAV